LLLCINVIDCVMLFLSLNPVAFVSDDIFCEEFVVHLCHLVFAVDNNHDAFGTLVFIDWCTMHSLHLLIV